MTPGDRDITARTLEARLLAAVPEFEPTLEEHRAGNGGQVLPHVLFGDLTRFVEAAARRGEWALVDRCLAFLDLAVASGDESIGNLVAASFVENLAPWDGANSAIFERLPAHLEAGFEQQRRWRPD